MTPKFLTLAEALEIHRDQMIRYGGSQNIRDLELLKSALGMAPTTFDKKFLHTDIHEMAAAYLFHIIKNHPFVDGNKRVGVVAALVFLSLNGYEFDAPEDELAETAIAVATGKLDKADLTVFIRRWTKQT